MPITLTYTFESEEDLQNHINKGNRKLMVETRPADAQEVVLKKEKSDDDQGHGTTQSSSKQPEEKDGGEKKVRKEKQTKTPKSSKTTKTKQADVGLDEDGASNIDMETLRTLVKKKLRAADDVDELRGEMKRKIGELGFEELADLDQKAVNSMYDWLNEEV